jgi:CubicO group peptidase (beta-lactamase class C family)
MRRVRSALGREFRLELESGGTMSRFVALGSSVIGGRSRGDAGLIGAVLTLAALMALASPSAALAGQPTDYAGVRATLSREIPAAMRASHTVGVSIALVDRNRTVWARGFGWANRAARVPVTAGTLFHIGSTSKSMAAAAVMQLVERGRVDLDAPLSRYVPQFRLLPRFPRSVITVRSVLDMHSGIPGDINNGSFTAGRPYPGYDTFLLRTLAKEYPERAVNTAYAYSNSGYALLQNLVQNVTGQNFATYTRSHLFGPMGMASTTFDDASVPGGALTHGYQAVTGADGAVRAVARPREYVNIWAAGSAVSSATDMAAYLKTMIAGGVAPTGRRILAKSTLQEMITPQTRLPLDITSFRAGLGWWVGDTGNEWMGPAVYWNGDTANIHTFLRWLPKLGLGVFVSVNTSSPAPVRDSIGLRALGLMVTATSGRKPPSPPRPAPVIKVPPSRLRRATGRYASTSTGVYTVTTSGGGLLMTPTPLPPGVTPVTMLPRANGWYAAGHPASDNRLAALWIKPATVAGRRLLLAHVNDSSSGPAPNGFVTTFAEKIPSSYRIPEAWQVRTGSYRATDTIPGTYPDVPRTGTLTFENGVLEWNRSVVAPAGPRLAFTFGFTSVLVQRGAGDALTSAGDTLTILGTTYQRINSPEPRPAGGL